MKKEQDGESGKSEESWINLARTAAIYLKSDRAAEDDSNLEQCCCS